MRKATFRISLLALAGAFTLAFALVCVPPFLDRPDLVAAFGAGFVNPYASGYALDVFFTWAILAAWVLYEAGAKGVRHGWIALLLGVVPGVAVGLAAYLLLRLRQEKPGA